MTTATSDVRYPWFKRQDVDGFFALFQNNAANFIIVAVTLLGFGYPPEIVFGRVIPGAAVAVLAGNLYYAWMAARLARREQRTDVTALAYGISTPVMFVFLFGVSLPALELTGDPETAWRVATAAALLAGVVEAAFALIGRWVKHHLPRAAMLGALAGVALTFIAGELLFTVFDAPIVGLVALAIVLVAFVGKVALPFRIPASLVAILIGTALAYAIGVADTGEAAEGLDRVGWWPAVPTVAGFDGLTLLFGAAATLLAVVLPITLYNAVETMNNVEAMEAAGDRYDVRECQAVDGAGTVIGALFGSMFPTTVYIASVGSKWMGAGRGYSILNGAVYLLAALSGLIAAMAAIIPLAAVGPILVFVGISMIATAYQTTEVRHHAAVAIAMLPYFANWVMTQFDGEAPEVLADVSEGIVPLGQGALFTAMLLGAITVFVIDVRFYRAAVVALVGAGLSFVGVIHAPELGLNASPDYSIAYVLVAALLAGCGAARLGERKVGEPVPDPIVEQTVSADDEPPPDRGGHGG
ncbi:NCS2 family permease [Egibacter rhizosphaerae]|uniref:NCS2 family permease n=1 Tax=Egibacter rhizosphaerae TaxID=1670831 RepID=A0A411YE60_9ACTN|nr:SulP family inorganic anion transporter [Egibacter rhizosphaerae]QBI19543.1 NCS2 family permease [Egibacter rhizosphaerae]